MPAAGHDGWEEGPPMTRRDPETEPRAFLGAELQRGRIAAGFTSQEALAGRLGFDRSVVGKAETGERPPTPEVLAAWCHACALDPDLFARMAALARNSDGPVPTWFEGWLEAEHDARMLRLWAPLLIPGLLQTAEYVRAMFVAAGRSEDVTEKAVTVRLERQAILDRPSPPQLVVVLDESVLHRLIGSPPVMADQLAHVADQSERPDISVQVVPAATGGTAGLGGMFEMASSEGGPEVVLMATAIEDVTTESRSIVGRAAGTFVRIQADALPRAASRVLIREAAERWRTG
jgi:transcriptional regulator with XRE-family HTH domain